MLGLGKKAKKLKSRAEQRISDIRSRESSERKEITDVENEVGENPERAASEEKDSLQKESQILEEIKGAESDLESLLQMDEEEFDEAVECFKQAIKLEKEQDEKLRKILEELQDIEDNLKSLKNEKFEKSFDDYKRDVIEQFARADPQRVYQLAKEGSQNPDELGGTGIEHKAQKESAEMLKKLLTEIRGDGLSMGEPGREIKDDMNGNENFGSYIKRTQDFSDAQMLKIAVNYNALVFGLGGRSRAVDKPRFIEIEENLEEIVEIKDSMRQIIDQLQGLGDTEEKVHKDVESELENIPHDLEQMNQLGDDLIKLKKEIKTVKKEDEELVKIEKKTQLGSHPKTHEKVDKELNKEEKILSDLENYIEKLVEEVAELEAESEKFEELDREEEKELERIIDREDGLLKIADELQEEWVQESKVLFGEPGSNNNQNSLDSELESEINKIFNTLRKTCTIISNTAKKLGKYSEQEYKQTERFAEIEEDFYQEEKRELENLSFSNGPKASQGSSVRSTAAD